MEEKKITDEEVKAALLILEKAKEQGALPDSKQELKKELRDSFQGSFRNPVSRPTKFFYFLKYNGKVVPLLERHALAQGFNRNGTFNRNNYKEYLGMFETDSSEPKYLEPEEDFIRSLTLPQIMPRETRSTFSKGSYRIFDSHVQQRETAPQGLQGTIQQMIQ